MCTVIYSPTSTGWLISSLRDEDPLRPRATFKPEGLKDAAFTGPVDPKGGGSWFMVNKNSNTIVLLNGAFQNHIVQRNYRKSRGLIVRELIQEDSPAAAWETTDLDQIEPFTLVMVVNGILWEAVWDGNDKYLSAPNPQDPHIWSSSTLYDTSAKMNRKAHFQSWCHELSDGKEERLMAGFRSLKDNSNGFLINRNEKIKTLSHTFFICKGRKNCELSYTEMDTGTVKSSTWVI